LKSFNNYVADNAVLLDAEQVLPLRQRNWDERAAGFRSRHREPSVVVGQENLGDEPVGLLQIESRLSRRIDFCALEMVVNRKAATALGLAVPPSILLRADEVIE
jgi:hypothetical protein